MKKPLIAEIKRNSLDDGPGIRTTVFFKGCPLSCVWCQNPETVKTKPEIMFSPSECIVCRICVNNCPQQAIDFQRGNYPIDISKCRLCSTCTASCPGSGLQIIGKYYSVKELSEIIFKDIPFFMNSGGGITLSGGEATLFPVYMENLLQALKFRKVDIILQTCGYYKRDVFQKHILPYLDQVYFDIKIIDKDVHRKYTGKDNTLILSNFKALMEQKKVKILPRIPLIPSITDTPENLKNIAVFLKNNDVKETALLPYNPTWLSKADNLGKKLPYRHEKWLNSAEQEACLKYFKGFSLLVTT